MSNKPLHKHVWERSEDTNDGIYCQGRWDFSCKEYSLSAGRANEMEALVEDVRYMLAMHFDYDELIHTVGENTALDASIIDLFRTLKRIDAHGN